MTVGPCIYPRCNDGSGNAALTTQVMCDRCRRHYRRVLDWTVLDYVTLKSQMPSPVRRGSQVRFTPARSFGHPAQWASDVAANIADELNGADESLREHLNLNPPPHPRNREAGRVEHAYRTLTDHFDVFCEYPGAEASAQQLDHLHQHVRNSLGQTRFAQRLPTPCPACDTVALTRDVQQITCNECHTVIRPEHYEFFARMVLDDLIEAYDTQASDTLA